MNNLKKILKKIMLPLSVVLFGLLMLQRQINALMKKNKKK